MKGCNIMAVETAKRLNVRLDSSTAEHYEALKHLYGVNQNTLICMLINDTYDKVNGSPVAKEMLERLRSFTKELEVLSSGMRVEGE